MSCNYTITKERRPIKFVILIRTTNKYFRDCLLRDMKVQPKMNLLLRFRETYFRIPNGIMALCMRVSVYVP